MTPLPTPPIGLPAPSSWYCLGLARDLPVGGIWRRTLAGRHLAVFRTASGALGCLDDFGHFAEVHGYRNVQVTAPLGDDRLHLRIAMAVDRSLRPRDVHPLLAPLPRGWRTTFRVEVPLVLATLVLWLAAPETYLRDTVGIAAPGAPEILLLRLYAGAVGSLVFAFYAWWLWQPRVHLPAFRAFQACLALGDLAIVAASLAHWPSAHDRRLLGVQIGMAAFWGLVRAVFLWRRSGRT